MFLSFKIIKSLVPRTDHHSVKMLWNMGDERMLLALKTHLRETPNFYTRDVGWEHLFSQTHTEHHSTLGIKHRANLLLPFHSCISTSTVQSHRQSCTTECRVWGQKVCPAHILQRLLLTAWRLPADSGYFHNMDSVARLGSKALTRIKHRKLQMNLQPLIHLNTQHYNMFHLVLV